MHSSTHEIQY